MCLCHESDHDASDRDEHGHDHDRGHGRGRGHGYGRGRDGHDGHDLLLANFEVLEAHKGLDLALFGLSNTLIKMVLSFFYFDTLHTTSFYFEYLQLVAKSAVLDRLQTLQTETL